MLSLRCTALTPSVSQELSQGAARLMAIGLALVTTMLVGTAEELLTAQQAERLDLVQHWRKQIAVSVDAQMIVDQRLFVDSTQPKTYVEVVTVPAAKGDGAADADKSAQPTVLARISADMPSRSGQPIGLKEAERQAKQEVRIFKRRGIEAETRVREVAQVRLYSLSSDGVLECRDAEDGRYLWVSRIGDRRLGYHQLGVNEHYVSVTNGSNLRILDAATGEEIRKQRTGPDPLLGSLVDDRFAMVPIGGGSMDVYVLDDPLAFPMKLGYTGDATALPTKASGSSRLAWGTDRSFVYVAEVEGQPSVTFRLGVDGVVRGDVVAGGGEQYFFATDTGQVYGLDASQFGRVIWSRPLGEPVMDSVHVAGDRVLVLSTYGNLVAMLTENGSAAWPESVRGIKRMLGVVGQNVFAQSVTGNLLVIDLESGSRVASIANISSETRLINRVTDRLYLVDHRGVVQCLRPEYGDLPEFVNPTVVAKQEAAEEQTDSPESKPAGDLPFETETPFGDDPFGAGEGMADDPFGSGGDDPFDF
ncbi:MAG: PQQ-binding-like beta-propeller repeat protein [Planctomycetota bacterium]